MPHTLNKKKIIGLITSAGIGILALILIGSIEVRATQTSNTFIEDALSVSPSQLPYGVVFPEEVLFKNIFIALSNSFLQNRYVDDVEYHIKQNVKARNPIDTAYCQTHANDLVRCYPTLCPYLSKEPDLLPNNDTGVPAFHDPSASTSIAYGRLAKSDHDTEDSWVIDFHVPCFSGQCAQDNVVPPAYELDPALEGKTFNCDLSIVVDRISYLEREGTIGFWKNWNKHKTYTQYVINGWLAAINTSSAWLISEAGYSANTTGMVNLINSSTSCNGSLQSCAKKKFLAQYLVTHLNTASGRKELTNTYNLSSFATAMIYLGIAPTNPVTLAQFITTVEGKVATSPTRAQFLLMQSVADFINNQGI